MQRVLQALLDERCRSATWSASTRRCRCAAKACADPDGLVEAARLALGPALAAVHSRGGLLQVLTLDPIAEQQLVESVRPGEMGAGLALPPGMVERLVDSATARLRAAEDMGNSPVLVCAAPLRAPLSRLLRTSSSRLPVLSYAEIDPTLRIETLGVIAHADALVA